MNSVDSYPEVPVPGQSVLALAPGLGADIRRRAALALPEECCGLLLGSGRNVAAIHPTPNALEGDRRRGFRIEATDVRDAWLVARRCQMDVIGSYHSHPGGSPQPSVDDARGGWALQVIAQVENGFDSTPPERNGIRLNAWRVDGDSIRELDIVEETTP